MRSFNGMGKWQWLQESITQPHTDTLAHTGFCELHLRHFPQDSIITALGPDIAVVFPVMAEASGKSCHSTACAISAELCKSRALAAKHVKPKCLLRVHQQIRSAAGRHHVRVPMHKTANVCFVKNGATWEAEGAIAWSGGKWKFGKHQLGEGSQTKRDWRGTRHSRLL